MSDDGFPLLTRCRKKLNLDRPDWHWAALFEVTRRCHKAPVAFIGEEIAQDIRHEADSCLHRPNASRTMP